MILTGTFTLLRLPLRSYVQQHVAVLQLSLEMKEKQPFYPSVVKGVEKGYTAFH